MELTIKKSRRKKEKIYMIGCRLSEEQYFKLQKEFIRKYEFINFSDFLRWKLID